MGGDSSEFTNTNGDGRRDSRFGLSIPDVGDGVETLDRAVEPAGDALAVRDGAGVRLMDPPLSSQRALRGARHLFVDGDEAWAAREDEVIHYAAGRTKVYRVDAPRGPVRAMVQAPDGILAVATDGARFSVDRFDGAWRRGRAAPGPVRHVSREGEELWVSAGQAPKAAVYRCGPPRYEPKEMRGLAGSVAAGGGVLVHWSGGELRWRRPGATAWTRVLAPKAHVDRWEIVEGSIVGMEGATAWVYREGWRRMLVSADKARLDRGVWVMRSGHVERWDGGETWRGWRLPGPEAAGPWGVDALDASCFWWMAGRRLYHADLGTLDVRRVSEDASLEVSCLGRERSGMVWVGTSRGVLRIEPGEMPEAGRLAGMPARSAGLKAVAMPGP